MHGELDDTKVILTAKHSWVGKKATVRFNSETPVIYYKTMNRYSLPTGLDEDTQALVYGQNIVLDYIRLNDNKTYGAMQISSRKLTNDWLEKSKRTK